MKSVVKTIETWSENGGESCDETGREIIRIVINDETSNEACDKTSNEICEKSSDETCAKPAMKSVMIQLMKHGIKTVLKSED